MILSEVILNQVLKFRIFGKLIFIKSGNTEIEVNSIIFLENQENTCATFLKCATPILYILFLLNLLCICLQEIFL
jgi:hypothetical protein